MVSISIQRKRFQSNLIGKTYRKVDELYFELKIQIGQTNFTTDINYFFYRQNLTVQLKIKLMV